MHGLRTLYLNAQCPLTQKLVLNPNIENFYITNAMKIPLARADIKLLHLKINYQDINQSYDFLSDTVTQEL